MSKAKYPVILVLLLSVLIAGCFGGKGKEEGVPTGNGKGGANGLSTPPGQKRQPSGTYISGTSAGDAETLNFILAADSASFGYAGLTIDSLATYDNQFKVQLRHLGKPVQVSDDGLVYTITIRDDLKWSDGQKVTSEDYVYTMKNLMFSDWLNYTYKSDWEEEAGGQTVFVKPEVVNETTFTITRQTVYPEFFDNAIINLVPYPKHIAQKYEGDVKAFTEAEEFNKLTYTGNLGTFKYEEWVRNDKFVASRNPDFYLGKEDGSPYFEKTMVKLFGSTPARMAALEAGDITSSGIEQTEAQKFQALPHLNVHILPTSGYLMLMYNLRGNGWDALKDKSVRQALAMAINKETLIQSVLLGFGEPAFSFIPKVSPWYVDEGLAKYGVGPLFDKNKAREMLLQAGYGSRRIDGSIEVKAKDGKPLKLTIVTNIGNKSREQAAFFIKQELAEIGIEVDIQLLPWPTLLRQYLMNKEPGSNQELRYNGGPKAISEKPWDLMVIGFNTNPVSPSGQEVFFKSDSGLNGNGYANAKVDELFTRLRTVEAVKESGRRALYAELSRLISEDMPVDFLAFEKGITGIKKSVQGVEPGINMGYNSHRWFYE